MLGLGQPGGASPSREFVEAVLKRQAKEEDELLFAHRLVLARRDATLCVEHLSKLDASLLKETRRLVNGQTDYECALVIGTAFLVRHRFKRPLNATEHVIMGRNMGLSRNHLTRRLRWVEEQRTSLRLEAADVVEHGCSLIDGMIANCKRRLESASERAQTEQECKTRAAAGNAPLPAPLQTIASTQEEVVELEKKRRALEDALTAKFSKMSPHILSGSGIGGGGGGGLFGGSSTRLGLRALNEITEATVKAQEGRDPAAERKAKKKAEQAKALKAAEGGSGEEGEEGEEGEDGDEGPSSRGGAGGGGMGLSQAAKAHKRWIAARDSVHTAKSKAAKELREGQKLQGKVRDLTAQAKATTKQLFDLSRDTAASAKNQMLLALAHSPLAFAPPKRPAVPSTLHAARGSALASRRPGSAARSSSTSSLTMLSSMGDQHGPGAARAGTSTATGRFFPSV